MAGLADLFPEEKPLTCFLQIVTDNIGYTVLNTTLYTALFSTVCTVLYTVPYTILYTDATNSIMKFIVFLTAHSTVSLPQYLSLYGIKYGVH